MSIIFGIVKPAGQQVAVEELTKLASATHRYAPDGTFVRAFDRVGMGFQPYHTHDCSRIESQPLTDIRGNLFVFDGRLDNRAELHRLLSIDAQGTADSSIVAAAFERWGAKCFSRFVGDWAMALWSAREQVTYLARDHAGARSLYFQITDRELRWATYLETFFANGERYPVDEQFAARLLCSQPFLDRTPYGGILAVPAAHYLAIKDHMSASRSHWNWIAKDRIRYKTDHEYEEHFVSLFSQSVERRTGPGAPVVAELSGGMDSTAIVCMSDHLRKSEGKAASDLLDTISYYDPSEPNWNEEPYFTATEMRRGKRGVHIGTSAAARTFTYPEPSLGITFPLWPGADCGTLKQEFELHQAIGGRGYRSIISGIGGDEVLGGVPTPLPELADLLVTLRLLKLAKQATAWSLAKRVPLLQMFYRTAFFAAALYRATPPRAISTPPWVNRELAALACAQSGGFNHYDRFGARPSALSNGQAWWAIQGSLPHLYPGMLTRYEYRYPYLDRDLVDYLYRIPREQLVRPGLRRSLMKRALGSYLPPEVLTRRRKAYVVHGPLAELRAAREPLKNSSVFIPID